MRSFLLGSILFAFLLLGSIEASPIASWGKWTGNVFTLERPNVEWKASEDNTTTAGAGSGGEWFDIEHLFVDVVTRDNETFLEWLIITSYPGVEPWWPGDEGEWTPDWSWRGEDPTGTDPTPAGTLRPGYGRNAHERDYGQPAGGTPSTWAYRQNPVLALDLYDTDETPTSGPIYDWALVLDSSERENVVSDWRGTPYDITTTPTLYRVHNAANFVEWVPPDGSQFPVAKVSDLNSSNIGDGDKWTHGTSEKRFADDHIEATDDQLPATYWRMDFNWYWTGSMQLTDNANLIAGGMPMEAPDAFDPSGKTSVHYAMWCGNDFIDANANGYSDETTPELSPGLLMILGAVPTGVFMRRRRQKS